MNGTKLPTTFENPLPDAGGAFLKSFLSLETNIELIEQAEQKAVVAKRWAIM